METIATKKTETKKEVKKQVPNYSDLVRYYGAVYAAKILNQL